MSPRSAFSGGHRNKKFVVSSLVVAFVALILGFVIHGVFLYGAYAKLPLLYRSEVSAQSYLGYMLIAHLSMGIGLTWIYRRGHEAGKPFVMQGVMFGAAMFAVMTLPIYLIYFAVMQLPSDLVAQQIFFDGIGIILLGVLTAWMNQTQSS